MEIKDLYTAKLVLKAYRTYQSCDKEANCKNSNKNQICCCYKECFLNYIFGPSLIPEEDIQDTLLNAIDYILNYLNRIGKEMCT